MVINNVRRFEEIHLTIFREYRKRKSDPDILCQGKEEKEQLRILVVGFEADKNLIKSHGIPPFSAHIVLQMFFLSEYSPFLTNHENPKVTMENCDQ